LDPRFTGSIPAKVDGFLRVIKMYNKNLSLMIRDD
jgi:hypothetical protein